MKINYGKYNNFHVREHKGDIIDKIFKKTLLIDLDGVLNEYSGNFDKNKIPQIKEGAYDFIERLYKKNYDIKIFTTRNKLLGSKWLIENQLDEFVSDITNVKDPAFLHIDDRCICYNGDFEETFNSIENFKAYWKN